MGGGNQKDSRAGSRRRLGPVAGVPRSRGRALVIGVLGVVALASAACSGGPSHQAAKVPQHAAADHVRTDPATVTSDPQATTTTTTAPAPKTDASTFTPPPAPAPVATTTTTSPLPAGCVWSNFASKVTTDQNLYSSGQPVQITLEFANAGPACTVNSTGYACPLVNIDNSAGALVWSNEAPTSVGCPSTFTGPMVLPANWTQSFAITWGQDTCVPGPSACPGPQVAAGPYQVIGQSGGGSSQIPAGTPVEITLQSS